MGRTPGLTAAEIEHRRQRVIFLLKSGLTVGRVSQDTGMSEARIYSIRREVFGKRHRTPRRFTEAECAQIESLLDAGCSIAEVARTVDRRPDLLARLYPGRGWTREQVAEHNSLLREIHRLEGMIDDRSA